MENLNEVKVKELRSNIETEFRNYKLEEFCDENGIPQNFSSPCIPEQNGVTERRNRTLIEAAKTMLNSAKLPKQFWGEAVNTARYTQNRSIIVKRHGKTSYDILRGRSPNISYFYVLGCPVYIRNHMDHLEKFDEKADDGFFHGYSQVAKAFKLADLISNFPHVFVLGSGFDLKTYFDSDYVALGGCQILEGKLVCWSAKKQGSVAMSSAEAEYQFIRDHILKGDIELYFIPTDLRLVDIFTKLLAEPSFTRLVAELGMLNIEKQEFWYTAEVKEETKTITFLLLWWDKPFSFTQYEFIYAIGLPISKLSEVPEQSLLPPSGEVNADDTADKSLSRASVQLVTQSKATTNLKTKKKKISPSSKPKSPHKVLDQHVEEEKDAEFVAMGEVDEQSLEIPAVEQLLDKADKLNKAVQEPPKSPYDTKSEIKVVKSFFTFHISKLKDQTMHDSKVTADIHEGSDLQSMPDDDLRSVLGFHTADSDDTHKNEVSKSDHIFQDDNASAERLSLQDHMDHICEEVSSLHSRLGDMESSIVQQVLAELKSSLQALVIDSLKEQMPSLLSDALKDTLL
uniref:Retrovirus-related Pol polyprotein from transposon TNT 1-94 n=1 Tax=Tanacetum cinerariifolium TaxID=118510 RepID=A0A699H674_TANCI|nr:retrovirus-related Pol polyprotein from transposon TNT 1-94 [Tanacetum cinerariifolium]